MASLKREPHRVPLIAFLASLIILLASCSDTDSKRTVRIYGGSKTGAYSKLIELLNERSAVLKNATVTPVDGSADRSCNTYREGCPLLSRFNFEKICEQGGSKPNLERLGMREKFSTNEPNRVGCSSEASENDFALVQNYFIAGAAKTYCGEGANKLGPDSLYFFEFFPKFPAVRSIVERRSGFPYLRQINHECDQFFDKQMDGQYEAFEDLRIVLPLYNGLVQFVTTSDVPVGEGKLPLKTLADLKAKIEADPQKSKKRIYLQGINEIYGAEVLNRDPRFHGAKISNLTHDDWRFDEKLVLRKKDIATLPGFSQSVKDFILDTGSEKVRGDRLLACGVADAYVISGEIVAEQTLSFDEDTPQLCRSNQMLQQIQIPEVIIDAMAVEHPYYQKLPPPAYWTETQLTAMPGLITYLVTTQSADESLVSELTEALVEDWDSLMLLDSKLTPIRDNILKKPAPLHEGAEETLREADLLGGGFALSQFVIVLAAIIVAMFYNNISRSKLAYNRLGEKQRLGLGSLAGQEALDFLIIILSWGFVFMFVVTMIRNWDAAIAATQNADDQISALSFSRTLLWMFTFISSGYEDNVFPSSSASQVVVSFFAIAGVAYPLFLIAQTWDRIRIKRQNRARGGEYPGLSRMAKDWVQEQLPWSYRSKGTLLLCGWNDKAPGLIYTLTCPDSPYEGMLSIIANTDVEYPIEHYNFNKSRVRFYRGDASHRSQLERAEAVRATSALILSENPAGADKNNSGVLTALAIERLRSEISVFAEMSTDETDREFMEQHIDNIIDPKLIARQVLTIGCFDNYVLDFVLDALSPDDHYEWYSKQVHELMKIIPDSGVIETVSELSISLQQIGISIVGICPNEEAPTSALFDPRFSNNSLLDPLKLLASMDRVLNKDDYVVCTAENPKSFRLGITGKQRVKEHVITDFFESSNSIVKPLRGSVSILIIGHSEQAKSTADHIKKTVSRISESTAKIKTSIVATDQLAEEKIDVTVADHLEDRDWTHILLLSSVSSTHSQEEHVRLAQRADSDTILRASFIRSTLARNGSAMPIIVAEVNHTNSRQLAQDAEISTVVPSSLLIERILARLVTGGGKVAELLCAMLSMQDDVFLSSAKLHAGHPLIGQSFATVLNTWYKDGRVLGVLPKSEVHGIGDRHRNSSDDFDWHFIMCPPSVEHDSELAEGDVVIILACTESNKPTLLVQNL